MNEINITRSISVTDIGGNTRLNLLNGQIDIPRKDGCYVVSSGCGSGKTTAIKQLIGREFDKGVLYSAFTIEECNDMYNYCKNLIGSELNGYKLKESDIIVLHSDYKSEGTDNNLWRNNPEEIMNKRIIICTHHKLLNESPLLLFGTKFNKRKRTSLNLLRRSMIGDLNNEGELTLPRKLILIDELPDINPIDIRINKNYLLSLGVRVIIKTPTLLPDGEEVLTREFITNKIDDFEDLRLAYDDYVKNDPSSKFFSSNDELSKLKEDLVLSIIQENYDDYLLMDTNSIKVSYNINSLALNGIQSRLILFDGTGDLAFINSAKFNVISYPNKYNSPIKYSLINYKLNRYLKPSDINEESLIEKLELVSNELYNIINNNDNTLVITWMNLKMKGEEANDESKSIINDKTYINPKFNLPRYYKDSLSKKGLINGYEIIHYGSGLDKATNKFKDYDAIVFLGEFHVPNYVITDFNSRYQCNTTSELYSMHRVVQAICRTRIRKHNGEGINVYFSEDWNKNIIESVRKYMGNGTIDINSSSRILTNKIKGKLSSSILELMRVYPKIKNSIESDTQYDLILTLDEIYKIIPKSQKKVKEYYPLINALRKIGINLTITSERRGRFSNKEE
jgi:hypothetical protein